MNISVLIPVRNAEQTLDQAIESVLSQTVKVRQIIVVNDGSTDRTSEIIARYKDREQIEVAGSSDQMGVARRLNEGLAKSAGDWIARLDADDWWQPNHIKVITEFLFRQRAQYSVIGTRARYVGADGKHTGYSPYPGSEHKALCYLLKDNPFVHSGVMFRRKLAQQVGGYCDSVRWEDYNLWIELAAKGRIAILPDVTVNHRKLFGLSSRVEKSIALESRFLLQKKAAGLFLKRCLLTGTLNVVISWLRLTLLYRGTAKRN